MKPSHMWSYVDGLACFLHCPRTCRWLTWVLCFMTGTALSRHATVVNGSFLGVGSPQDWIFTVVLTVWVHERPNLTWRNSLY
jgi:hypothetical protein